MNWRNLVMRLAAQIADLTDRDLGNRIRAFKVPFIDSGGGFLAKRSGSSTELGASWQILRRPAPDELALLILPASLWDEPRQAEEPPGPKQPPRSLRTPQPYG